MTPNLDVLQRNGRTRRSTIMRRRRRQGRIHVPRLRRLFLRGVGGFLQRHLRSERASHRRGGKFRIRRGSLPERISCRNERGKPGRRWYVELVFHEERSDRDCGTGTGSPVDGAWGQLCFLFRDEYGKWEVRLFVESPEVATGE